MKKLVSALFVAVLALQVSSVSFASEPVSAKSQHHEKVIEQLDKVEDLNASIRLEDRTIKVKYQEKTETVKVTVKKDSEKQSYEWTNEEIKEKIRELAKNIEIDDTWNKEELAKKFAKALNRLPSEIISIDSDLHFAPDHKISFSFKQGKDNETLQSYLPTNLDLNISGKNGQYYNIHYKLQGDTIKVNIQKNTANGKKSLKGLSALMELARLKGVIIPDSDMEFSNYLKSVSKELGIPAAEIEKVVVKTKFDNEAKADFRYTR
ncbi:hypothetical protein [Metabacillus arenae]|uniref:Uncharacterized protein n=1 Tax=Metabacillus arenae TaxID=2771434 RepID=A0A926NKU4_9BACI|nr:hypothetical protein [Metabacillus arenae]MBD1382453.1 hypothetical protein [Metabacillus arenae]